LMGYCHCSMCRTAHGAAFSSFAVVAAREFRFTRGEDLVELYESSPGHHRGFCRVCGSNAPVRSPNGKAVFVAAGSFDDDPEVRPTVHLFVGSKASWWEPNDDLPKFDTFPEEPDRK